LFLTTISLNLDQILKIAENKIRSADEDFQFYYLFLYRPVDLRVNKLLHFYQRAILFYEQPYPENDLLYSVPDFSVVLSSG